MKTDDDINRLAKKALDQCLAAGKRVVTVESCTGGLISALLTSIPGSSTAFERGFVTYSNEAKQELVGVPKKLIDTYGAVSEQVAEAMAKGGIEYSNADVAIAVTGIAGPDGGTAEKPVGLVYIATAARKGVTIEASVRRFVFSEANRDEVRNRSARKALEMLLPTECRDQ
jgi:nicotinamide-nucleotide amidase